MLSSPSPKRLTLAVSPPAAGAAVSESEPPYPEPEFSRPLLFALLAVLTLAQIGYEGIRFGLQNSQHVVVLPLLDFLHNPQTARGDILHLLAPAWTSPFWSLLAAIDGDVINRSFLFSLITVAARWASVVALFRISERAFGHPLAALLAALLWLGLPSVGGTFLHRDFLASSDVSLAFLLWAILLWKEEHERWGLLCGLAACVDAPLGLLVFSLLWCIGWLPLLGSTGRTRWALRHGAELGRKRGHLQAIFWFTLGVVPLWPPVLAHANSKALADFGHWFARLQSLDAGAFAAAGVRAPWTLPAFLIVGAWCWKKAARHSPPAHATSVFAWCLLTAVIVSAWLLQSQMTSPVLLVLMRAAPLAATLCIVAMARVVERGAARRGSVGFMLLWIWAGLVVFAGSTFYLVAGVLLMELLNLLARQSSRRQKAIPRLTWKPPPALPLRNRDIGRWALIAFVLVFCWRGRGAVGERLQSGAGPLSRPQARPFLQAQRWAARYTPPSSVYLSSESGFRTFSKRAAFLDAGDERFAPVLPAFAKGWKSRNWLASPLWKQGPGAAGNAVWLRRLRAYGVTHLVLTASSTLPGSLPVKRIYANREWAIYRLR